MQVEGIYAGRRGFMQDPGAYMSRHGQVGDLCQVYEAIPPPTAVALALAIRVAKQWGTAPSHSIDTRTFSTYFPSTVPFVPPPPPL